jgi:hypothetical protein
MRYGMVNFQAAAYPEGIIRAPEFSLYIGCPIPGTAECPYGLSHPDREGTTADTLSKQSYRRKDSLTSHTAHSGETT